MMLFRVNGKNYERIDPITIDQFIKELKLHPESVIVEYNKEFLPHKEFKTTLIKEGDQLEIVRAFAGGV